jgi:hypothetical protein
MNPNITASMTPEQKAELLELLETKAKRKNETKLYRYKPYAKQKEFHNTISREKMFLAGSQIGKTYCSANEIAYHLTGLYPSWWKGRKFDAPTVGWAAGVTSESTRDTLQGLMVRRPNQIDTGAIPGNLIVNTAFATSSRPVTRVISLPVAINDDDAGEVWTISDSYALPTQSQASCPVKYPVTRPH